MEEQASPPYGAISRRRMLQGLLAYSVVSASMGCASPPSSSKATPPAATPTLSPGSIVNTYSGHSEQVLAVAWSPNGRQIASGARDMTLQVWDAFTGQHAHVFRGYTDAVSSVAWSPDGRSVASASWDKTVRVWDISTDK